MAWHLFIPRSSSRVGHGFCFAYPRVGEATCIVYAGLGQVYLKTRYPEAIIYIPLSLIHMCACVFCE